MFLFEHPDFDQAIIRAAEHFRGKGLRPAMIEKDYYVTEALRIVAREVGGKVIFKGGTSLSKGWNLIDRFLGGCRHLPRSRGVCSCARQARYRPRIETPAGCCVEVSRLRVDGSREPDRRRIWP